MNTKPILRCAIYTRKSTEEGLDQEFNSLHAQREACAAYIASQKHEGWQPVKTHYDDGGYSGGNMERPALKQLLDDIETGKVNVVVVYKVDRLTRSLADFAKIIEHFDKRGVSFVSVTQQFNTTSSMGRLTLNILLSFAQFEREVTGERIRDKIAASKKKGMWMGGFIPLGYDLDNRKLAVNEEEARTVQYIYRRYLELGCVRLLKEDLDSRGIRSKARRNKAGCSLSRGLLYKILSNPIYIGEIRHKGISYPGQHQAIIDRGLWEQVQRHMADNSVEHKARSSNNRTCPLSNKVFDASGERLVSAHANKKGRRYRYYISESLRSDPKAASPAGWRLPAQEIEQAVAGATLEILRDDLAVTAALQESGIPIQHISSALDRAKKLQPETADMIQRFVQRVELRQDGMHLTISLSSLVLPEMKADKNAVSIVRDIPMQMKRRGIEMRLVIGNTGPGRVDQSLVKTIIRAHKWFNDLASGKVKNMTEIALREGVDRSYVSRVLNLAFLAPDITESIMEGRQPADLNIERLTKRIDLPLSWAQQRQLLGFNNPLC
ncbi:MAG: recombinase family protein [Syntrophales bacterium]|jgi:DNA invertase Pin-like site-specific DNA recombinase|nr:recombinase family protein [Syntrophales bacterium]